MAPHPSALAWRIPWTEEPGGLQSMGLLGVGHDWTTSLSLFTFLHWRRKWQPTPVFLPGESQGRESLWAAICGVTQSQTQLTWLSSSSSKLLRDECPCSRPSLTPKDNHMRASTAPWETEPPLWAQTTESQATLHCYYLSHRCWGYLLSINR